MKYLDLENNINITGDGIKYLLNVKTLNLGNSKGIRDIKETKSNNHRWSRWSWEI